jgi:hypothetical protein
MLPIFFGMNLIMAKESMRAAVERLVALRATIAHQGPQRGPCAGVQPR